MSDKLLRRMAILVEIADRRKEIGGHLGKTAMQKLLYLLQEGLGVELGYRFGLYTYGPYDSAVMQDLDYAAWTNLLDVKYQGEAGYDITPGSQTDAVGGYIQDVRTEAGEKLGQVFQHFGHLNAAELELRATLLYVVKDNPRRSDDDILDTVGSIKPKFNRADLELAGTDLKQSGLWPQQE